MFVLIAVKFTIDFSNDYSMGCGDGSVIGAAGIVDGAVGGRVSLLCGGAGMVSYCVFIYF